MRITIRLIILTLIMISFSSCREKKVRLWYCKEANVKLKICVKDSCDVFIINDYDSIFTKHNRINYAFYALHFIDGTDSLFFIDELFQVLKVKQKNYIISVYQPDTIHYFNSCSKILEKRGLTIRGGEDAMFTLFINNEYNSVVPQIAN